MKFKVRHEAADYSPPSIPLHPLIFLLRKRRYDLNMSTRLVADRAGLSFKTLQKYENGHASPNFISLLAWAAALNMELDLKCQ